MKNKAILVSFIALFAIVLALNTVLAECHYTEDAEECDVCTVEFANIEDVTANDISLKLGSKTAAGEVSDTIPVEVKFTANCDVSDVRVKVYVEGYKEEISETTSRFRIVEGSSYIERFALKLPSSIDLDEDPEDLVLYVRMSSKGGESIEEFYPITMQRELYELSLYSVEAPDSIVAGSVIAVDVVLHNSGSKRLDDTYVRVSIPGITERNVYFGDISADADEEYSNIRDTLSKRIYLDIPSNAISGVYNLEIEAYNYDANTLVKKQIALKGVKAEDKEKEDEVEVIDGVDNGKTEKTPNNTALILTVVLAIIFIVLLIILIVLLTKKPSETEELTEGETNYY